MPMIVSQGSTTVRVLLLGGTTEASEMARRLAETGVDSVFSYAGRTTAPIPQPLPVRVGGFGGAEGLAEYLVQQRISHVIDATHAFAAQMSRNAVEACAAVGIPLAALERAPWRAEPGDDWQNVADVTAAAAALPMSPSRVFLAIGRQMLEDFARRPEHFYLLRLVDPLTRPLAFPDAQVVFARGPFTLAGDLALIRDQGVTHIVSKNSGGDGGRAKLLAARTLRLPVIMIERPALPSRRCVASVGEAMAWLGVAHAHRDAAAAAAAAAAGAGAAARGV